MLVSQDPVTPGAARMETAQRTHVQNEGSLCLAWTSVLYSLYSNPATISVVPESTTYIVTCHPPFASLMTGPTGPKDVAPTLAYRHSGYRSVVCIWHLNETRVALACWLSGPRCGES